MTDISLVYLIFQYLGLGLIAILLVFFSFPKKKLPPGPFPWPLFGSLLCLDDRPYRKMNELSKIYGSLMGLYLGSVYSIVISSPEMAKEILQINDRHSASRKLIIAGDIISSGGYGIASPPHGPYWRKIRKLIHLHLFSNEMVQLWLPKRMRVFEIMADTFSKEAKLNDGVVEVRRIISQATMNNIMMMVAGKHYLFASHGESPKEGDELMKLIRELLLPVSEFNVSDFVPFFSFIDPQGVAKRARDAKKKSDRYFTALIDERIEKREEARTMGEENDEFLDKLLSFEGEDKLSKAEIIAMIQDLFLAGTDTPSLVIEWALAELILHPEKMERLRKELESIDVSLQTDFSKLPYLQAVLKETFRLHNPAPILIPHQTSDPFEINGYEIPSKTIVFVNTWAISREPQLWPEPEAFQPERFLVTELDIRGRDFRLFPYGSGRRMCPGMNLGQPMVEAMLSILVKRFRWTLPHGVTTINMVEKYTLNLSLANPLYACISEVE